MLCILSINSVYADEIYDLTHVINTTLKQAPEILQQQAVVEGTEAAIKLQTGAFDHKVTASYGTQLKDAPVISYNQPLFLNLPNVQSYQSLLQAGMTEQFRNGIAAGINVNIFRKQPLNGLLEANALGTPFTTSNETQINLAAKALFLGWDIICLGRTGSAQSFQTGRWGSKLSIHREGKALWIERAAIEAGDLLMRSKAGLSGCSVYATFVATVQTVQASLIQECRTVVVEKGVASVSQLPGLLVGRYLGDSSQAAKNYFIALWQKVRPVVVGCEAQRPRIWNT